MTTIRKRQHARFYIYKKQKITKRLYINYKIQTPHKKQDTIARGWTHPLKYNTSPSCDSCPLSILKFGSTPCMNRAVANFCQFIAVHGMNILQ